MCQHIVKLLTINAKDTLMNHTFCFCLCDPNKDFFLFFFMTKMATSNIITAYRVFCSKSPIKC